MGLQGYKKDQRLWICEVNGGRCPRQAEEWQRKSYKGNSFASWWSCTHQSNHCSSATQAFTRNSPRKADQAQWQGILKSSISVFLYSLLANSYWSVKTFTVFSNPTSIEVWGGRDNKPQAYTIWRANLQEGDEVYQDHSRLYISYSMFLYIQFSFQ